jgi:hypothetical protein
MKSLSHFENSACPAALRRLLSCPRTTRRFTRLDMSIPTCDISEPPDRATRLPLPRQPRPYSAYIQSP